MPEITGRLRTPRLASAPSSPVVGEVYYDTAVNKLKWWNGTAWINAEDAGAGSGPALVSALPGSPVDGQEVHYQNAAMATDGVIWRLRYRVASSSAYKWELVGGSALSNQLPPTEVASIASTTYVDFGPGPAVTAPLAGEYEVTIHARMWNAVTGPHYNMMSPRFGAGPAIEDDSIMYMPPTNSYTGQAERTYKKTLTAGLLCRCQYRVSGGTGSFDQRRMAIRPVRVS